MSTLRYDALLAAKFRGLPPFEVYTVSSVGRPHHPRTVTSWQGFLDKKHQTWAFWDDESGFDPRASRAHTAIFSLNKWLALKKGQDTFFTWYKVFDLHHYRYRNVTLLQKQAASQPTRFRQPTAPPRLSKRLQDSLLALAASYVEAILRTQAFHGHFGVRHNDDASSSLLKGAGNTFDQQVSLPHAPSASATSWAVHSSWASLEHSVPRSAPVGSSPKPTAFQQLASVSNDNQTALFGFANQTLHDVSFRVAPHLGLSAKEFAGLAVNASLRALNSTRDKVSDSLSTSLKTSFSALATKLVGQRYGPVPGAVAGMAAFFAGEASSAIVHFFVETVFYLLYPTLQRLHP